MTNKDLFEKLPYETRMQVVKTLAAYNKVHVDWDQNGYTVNTSHVLTRQPRGEIRFAEFEAKEFYPKGSRYHLDWYLFCRSKEKAGEKNETYKINGEWHGKWQDEFEEIQKPKYEAAYNYFLKA